MATSIRTPFEHFLEEARAFTKSTDQATKVWGELLAKKKYDTTEGRLLTLVSSYFLRDIRRVAREYISQLTGTSVPTELPTPYFSVHPVKETATVRKIAVASFLDGMTHVENERYFVSVSSTIGTICDVVEVFPDACGAFWAVVLRRSKYILPGVKQSYADWLCFPANLELITTILKTTEYSKTLMTVAAFHPTKTNDFLGLCPGEYLFPSLKEYRECVSLKLLRNVFTQLGRHKEHLYTECRFVTMCFSKLDELEIAFPGVTLETYTTSRTSRDTNGVLTLKNLCSVRGIYWNTRKNKVGSPVFYKARLYYTPVDDILPLNDDILPLVDDDILPLDDDILPISTEARMEEDALMQAIFQTLPHFDDLMAVSLLNTTMV